MKLFRIEFEDGVGCFNSRFASEIKAKFLYSEYEFYISMSKTLHAPRIDEFSCDFFSIPSEAVYYFKETSKLDYMGLYKLFRKYSKKVKLIEIDMNELQKYEIFYQDVDQVFMQIK